ncbi:MBL fold metallo-hydrolase [bacterium]|nr:MBL fold metallo-hydrolase [candidate division CSSED10-310 bacterium]
MKIAEGFFAYYWQDPATNNCNSYFIDGAKSLLIDTGHKQFAAKLKERIRADGFDPAKIDVIVTTHAHPDHMEANEVFDHEGLLYGMHEQEEVFIEEIGRAIFQRMGMPMPSYRVDFLLDEGDLVVGDTTLQILHTPGHSPGSICLYWPDYRVLFSGDLVLANGMGRVDLPGGDAGKLAESIGKLQNLELEAVFPGHGPPIVGAARVEHLFKALQSYISRYL